MESHLRPPPVVDQILAQRLDLGDSVWRGSHDCLVCLESDAYVLVVEVRGTPLRASGDSVIRYMKVCLLRGRKRGDVANHVVVVFHVMLQVLGT